METVYFPRTNLTLDFQFLKQIQFYPGEFPSSDPFNQGPAAVLGNPQLGLQPHLAQNSSSLKFQAQG